MRGASDLAPAHLPPEHPKMGNVLNSAYAVLLRCGYDFFRDISISGMIARENYRYYKAMREILRAENGNTSVGLRPRIASRIRSGTS